MSICVFVHVKIRPDKPTVKNCNEFILALSLSLVRKVKKKKKGDFYISLLRHNSKLMPHF